MTCERDPVFVIYGFENLDHQGSRSPFPPVRAARGSRSPWAVDRLTLPST